MDKRPIVLETKLTEDTPKTAQFFTNCLPESQMVVDNMILSLIIWAP